ncbi:MAG: hypothetical protein K1X53_11610 [Candidatus Sumerlaeaceae bacterium]|nr:hypothetical protein [Candidatus Sumerlaeaceae bacterium]
MARFVKGPVKSESPMLVNCKLTDCVYHEGSPNGQLDRCLCSHPNKTYYISNTTCPLYSMDWTKKLRKPGT